MEASPTCARYMIMDVNVCKTYPLILLKGVSSGHHTYITINRAHIGFASMCVPIEGCHSKTILVFSAGF